MNTHCIVVVVVLSSDSQMVTLSHCQFLTGLFRALYSDLGAKVQCFTRLSVHRSLIVMMIALLKAESRVKNQVNHCRENAVRVRQDKPS